MYFAILTEWYCAMVFSLTIRYMASSKEEVVLHMETIGPCTGKGNVQNFDREGAGSWAHLWTRPKSPSEFFLVILKQA